MCMEYGFMVWLKSGMNAERKRERERDVSPNLNYMADGIDPNDVWLP